MHYMNDYYELALAVCGMDPDADESFEDEAQEKVDEILEEKLGVDSEQFEAVAKALMPFAHISKTAISETMSIGFADHEKSMWLIAQPYKAKKP